MELSVEELAGRIGATLRGEGGRLISAVGPIGAACGNEVTFISDTNHLAGISESSAGAVIVGQEVEDVAIPQLVVDNVDAALIEVLTIFAPELKPAPAGIDPTAKVAADVKVGAGVSIGAHVVIADGAQVGDNSVIGSGCKIGQNSKVGRDCRLDCNVVIYHDCVIGNNCIIQANTTIGSTGFGYSLIDGAHSLIPHNGGVVIEDFVETGASCCIDRAKFGNTVIGAGTKLDNLVHIAHNVIVGRCCLIAGHVGISGSCRLGDSVVLAGQAGLADNIELGNGVVVGGQSGVSHNTPAGKTLFGSPAIELSEAKRIIGLTRRLPKLIEKIKLLVQRVEKLEAAKDNKK